jgi:hypothetical protein
MSDRLDEPAPAAGANASCAMPGGEVPEGFLDGGGGCPRSETQAPGSSMSRPARRARAAAGLGFLAAAGALSTRQLPGRIALWPAALVPTWFGISHLLASVTGYPGCPELGAIPSVILDRPVSTGCGPWGRIDRRLGDRSPALCGCRRLRPKSRRG